MIPPPTTITSRARSIAGIYARTGKATRARSGEPDDALDDAAVTGRVDEREGDRRGHLLARPDRGPAAREGSPRRLARALRRDREHRRGARRERARPGGQHDRPGDARDLDRAVRGHDEVAPGGRG